MEKVIDVQVGSPMYKHIITICVKYEVPKFKWENVNYTIVKLFPSVRPNHISIRLKA